VIRLEAWLAPEGRWWLMPYTFASRDEAEAWLVTFGAENPARLARIAEQQEDV
jgi:hypothetical protein